MNLYKKVTARPYSFLAIDTTPASNNSLRLRQNLLERLLKLIVTTDDKIKYENYNAILTEKQQKYRHYHQVKLINMNISKVKKYYLMIKNSGRTS